MSFPVAGLLKDPSSLSEEEGGIRSREDWKIALIPPIDS